MTNEHPEVEDLVTVEYEEETAETEESESTDLTVRDLHEMIAEEVEKVRAEARRERAQERRKIIEVAREAAGRHNLCPEVDRALEQAGLLGPGVRKKLTIQLKADLIIEMDEDTAELSEEELREMIGGLNLRPALNLTELHRVSGVAYGNIRRSRQEQVNIQPIELLSVEDPPEAPTPGDGELRVVRTTMGRDYYAGYVSERGQVLHYFPADQSRPRRVSLCGTFSDHGPFNRSSRGQERFCSSCSGNGGDCVEWVRQPGLNFPLAV